jgi:hypothetical protein
MPAAEWNPVIDDILAAIATTPKSLESICSELESAPTARTVYRWIESDAELCQRYTRAKAAQLQVLADQLIDLADTDRVCEKVTIKPDGSREVVILDQVERTKLQIDTRKWLLSKLDPKKYGDKVQQELSGEVGIKTVIVQPDVKIERERPAMKPEFGE